MSAPTRLSRGPMILAEMQEYGSFDLESRNYICRSLDVASGDERATGRWVRNEGEATLARAQGMLYRALPLVRRSIPTNGAFVSADSFLFPLIGVSTFDVGGGSLSTFDSYRFLYERLLGPDIRPWLPSAFLAAATLPHLPRGRRSTLFASARDAVASSWSDAEPHFCPERLPAP